MAKTLIEVFHEEMTTDLPKATLYTFYQDSLLLHRVVMGYKNASPAEQVKIVNRCFHTVVESSETQSTTKPHAMREDRTALTQSPMCGAYARQTGKPCRQPAMRDKKKCRLHGGKSTGRPVKKGLRATAYKKHARRVRWLAKMMKVE